ncbi:MAG: hypothetical protein PHW63_06005, partial [Alphaproteobacteria bacterium]|nr:hypothetical protein [Alphaproteobacteria bacterium]
MRKCLKQRLNDRAVENFLSLYEKHKEHLDAHFVSEICTGEMQKIDARVWELLLCEYFTEQKLDFISPDHGPDFKIQSITGKTIWVEAICPNIQLSKDEKVINYLRRSEEQSEFVEVPEENLDLVITSAMKEKNDKFIKYIKEAVVGEGDIMLIA